MFFYSDYVSLISNMASDPRAFISFDCDHNEDEKILFVGQIRNSRTPFNAQDWSSKSGMPEGEWEDIIEDKINRCNLVIVLVGKHTAGADGVVKEIAMAHQQNVPVFGVYVGSADNSTNLPLGLPRNRTIFWVWDQIANAIDKVMTEGKNRS